MASKVAIPCDLLTFTLGLVPEATGEHVITLYDMEQGNTAHNCSDCIPKLAARVMRKDYKFGSPQKKRIGTKMIPKSSEMPPIQQPPIIAVEVVLLFLLVQVVIRAVELLLAFCTPANVQQRGT